MPTGNLSKTCRWVTSPGSKEAKAQYCERPVGWVMMEDGDEPGAAKVRVYNTFCPKHEKMVTDMEMDFGDPDESA